MGDDAPSAFESFCGGPFWDANLTWSNDAVDPDFTACFHKTVLSWAPAVVIALLAPIEVRRLRASRSRSIPRNVFNVAKAAFTAALVVIAVVDLILLATSDEDGRRNVVDADYVAAAVVAFGSGLSLFLLIASLIHGVRTSPTQFAYYLAATICEAFTLRCTLNTTDVKSYSTFNVFSTDQLFWLTGVVRPPTTF